MRTREERRADRQARRQARRDSNNELITGVVSAAFGNPTPPPPPPTPTPPLTPPVVEEPSVVDPVQDELSRQRDEVMAGNVNSAQADYFREQNEGLFMRERKGTNPSLAYNKSEKITGANPVSNREDKMTKLFGGLYGSDESRGIL
tara:strand:+ start:74 stop:511 length:438 start_codon:yes stop_codon:yes gene_type:complete